MGKVLFIVLFHFCLILTGQDHTQEPGAHIIGPSAEDAVLFLQETQPEP